MPDLKSTERQERRSWWQTAAIQSPHPLFQSPNCLAATISLGYNSLHTAWATVHDIYQRKPQFSACSILLPSCRCRPALYRQQFPDSQNQALTLQTFSLLVVYCWFVKYRLSIESCCALHQASVVTCLLRKWFKREIMQWITNPAQPTKNWVMKQHNHHTSASHYLI